MQVLRRTGVVCTLVVGLFAAFWVLTWIAGPTNPDYRAYRDFISALASFGAQTPFLGVAAIVCTALAHLFAVPILLRWDRIVGWCIFDAGLALLTVAAFRIHCPAGAGHCLNGGKFAEWTDVVHGVGVFVYSGAMVVAMVVAAFQALRVDLTSLLGFPGLGLAVLFVITLAAQQAQSPGVPQRLWALIGQIWLVGAVVVGGEHPRRPPRSLLRQQHSGRVT